LQIDEHEERIKLDITKLGNHSIILGYQWLKIHNPEIDWPRGTLTFMHCPRECLSAAFQITYGETG
jgi:hypothetical protein